MLLLFLGMCACERCMCVCVCVYECDRMNGGVPRFARVVVAEKITRVAC